MATLPISPPSTSLSLNPIPNFLPHRALLPLGKGGSRVLPLVGGGSRLTAGRVEALDFSTAFYGNDDGEDWDLEDLDEDDEPTDFFADAHDTLREKAPCPPGLREYETLTILRPDMSEDERLALVEKYEELLVAGGGMYVEVYNKGVFPLDFGIKKKNKEGETNTYWDGIYLMFAFYTKPGSMSVLESTLLRDDNVIRFMSLNRKRKLKFFRDSAREKEKEDQEKSEAREKLEAQEESEEE